MSEPTPAAETQAGDALLAELADDYLRRFRAGERPSVDEYAKKHPQLSDRIRDLFPAVLIMEQPGLGPTPHLGAVTERAGATIGRYKLLERIGEGGFGVVYMAEQQHPVRRKVALKVIKPDFDTQQVIARFEAERQALALMDHANIARVLDAGATDSGRPYFVMELVRGVPITDYCDQNQLEPRGRLELFVQVCRAVQHAHTKGIIHRDIKPTNVLVTMHDGTPVPKVIDFGVAKAAGQQLTERTLFTNFAQMIGTPLYMSPEQAEMSALDVDTRSDIYSLGVLLYELLTGTTPVDKERLKRAAFDEVRRIIREEEPPRPSTRISTLGERLATVSAHCRTDPRRLGRLVRGELDWIVMRALEKNRTRRYETANGLARDVERYLHDEPVEACPPSATYRLRKLVHRYRAPLAAAAAFVLLLVAASVISTWLAVRATRAERQVVRERDRVMTEKTEKEAALVEKQAALGQAIQSERTARERLATQLIALGDAALVSGRSAARDSYREAWGIAREMGTSELPAVTGLLASYPEQPPPVMGSDGRSAGIGGFKGHTRSPAVRFMADGRRAASASWDGSIIVWDVPRGAALRRFPGVGQNTHQMALAPDGHRLLTADDDKLLRLWDVESGEVIRTFGGHTDSIRGVAFSPDATRAISASSDGTVRLWDVHSGTELRRMKAPSHATSVEFLPDGRRAVSCGEPDVTVLWDLEKGEAIHTMSEGSGSVVIALAISPDGRMALSGGMSNRIVLWDLDSGTPLRAFSGHAGVIRSLALSPDGRLALSGSSDRTVRLWDVATARQIGIWHGHVGHVLSTCFSPDGRLALSGDGGGAIKLWDLRQQQETLEFRGHGERVISLSVTDGRVVLSGSFDKTVRLWDVATGLPLLTLATGDSAVWGVALAPDLRTALSAQEDGAVALWDLSTASRIRNLGKHDDVATGVAFSPEGRSALSCSSDKTLKLWDLQGGNLLRTFAGHTYKVRAVTFAPDGRTALSASFDRTLMLWDVDSGKALRTFNGHAHWVHSVAFSPDGRRAASGGWDYRWGMWDVASGNKLQLTQWDPAVVTGVAFSPDGKLLVTGSIEGSLGLWDLVGDVHVRDLQRQQHPFEHAASFMPTSARASPHHGGITSVAFCGDGATVLAGTRDGRIARWQVDRPARYDEFATSLPPAREALAVDPTDGKALAVFGRWYAFRGLHDWAAEFLEKARDRGGDVSSLELARCYWHLDRRADAAREFGEAIRRNEAPRQYLELCRAAVQKPPASQPSPTVTNAAPH